MSEKGMNTVNVENNDYALLSCRGRYSLFSFRDKVITFMHGKDLLKYLFVKEWDNGYIVVECLGKIKGEYEDYIDLAYILENLYMDPDESLREVKGVLVEDV